ncbi:hypothetical protein AND_009194 [Anopheles darlingi]|uniref:Cytochrome oxidase complex assembly protein 1 n=1 Tax=Anopheles darlingi TaxID=43151 RepID=W5J759_ANODA|nr:hypothetical protein AND_009194 [Anopheles darlingi]
MVSMKTLVKTAAYIAVGGITAALIMKVKLEDKIRQQPYYKDSLKLLRSHAGAIQLLGEPIKDLSFDMGIETQKFGGGKIDGFEVPVKGSLSRGKYYFWAELSDGQQQWIINRAELALASDPDRRLLIKGTEERRESSA